MRPDSNADWRQIGQEQPYYGVLSQEDFRPENLSPAALEAFFDSGTRYVTMVLDQCTRFFGPDWVPGRALDFGCGVGRLSLPLSRRFAQVTGLDVAPAMLSEAERLASLGNAANLRWLPADDRLSAVEGESFDFILSFIVFQHIPERRGQQIFARLLQHLAPGGIGVFHFKYAQVLPAHPWSTFLSHRVPGGRALINGLRGKPLGESHMQMNAYSLNRVLQTIQAAGFREIHTRLEDHGGHWGVELYLRRGH
jgi:SAM-dependent methyltransferase